MLNSFQSSKRKGFTLLELLVVISIIAILIGLATVSYSTAQKKARNSKRRSDLKAVQNAFEQYYSVNGSYDTSCATMAAWGTPPVLANGLPVDPKNQAPYSYTLSCSPSGSYNYCICANLESELGNSNSSACAYAAGGSFYCLNNLQ